MVNTESSNKPFRVVVIGGGLGGLALANGLLKNNIDCVVYERDTPEDISKRIGYHIRIAVDGVAGLKACLTPEVFSNLAKRYGADENAAPVICNPASLDILVDFASISAYPKSKSMARSVLRAYMQHKPLQHKVLHLGTKMQRYEMVGEGEDERVKVHFADGSTDVADILIAADGNRSRIAAQAGLKNSITHPSQCSISSRGPVPDKILAALPAVLREKHVMGVMSHGIVFFAAIYKPDEADNTLTGDDMEYLQTAEEHKNASHLFWDMCIHDGAVSDQLAAAAAADTGANDGLAYKQYLYEHALSVLSNSAKFNPQLLDIIKSSEVGLLRFTRWKLSEDPGAEWRSEVQKSLGTREAGNSRVVVMGDAMHAMTPGRGQGGNQALRDAGELLPRLVRLASLSPSSRKFSIPMEIRSFDDEMRIRAFAWVRSSSQSTDMDLTTWKGQAKLNVFWLFLTAMSTAKWAGSFLRLTEADGNVRFV